MTNFIIIYIAIGIIFMLSVTNDSGNTYKPLIVITGSIIMITFWPLCLLYVFVYAYKCVVNNKPQSHKGHMRNIKVYPKPLNSDEIQDIYNEQFIKKG